MNQFLEILKKKWLRDTSKTIILILMLFVVFLGVNILVEKLDLKDIDVTKNKLFTLSETSKNQIKDVTQNVKIYLIGYEENTSITDLVKQYTEQNNKITYEVIEDIQDRVDLKAKYSITDETQIIIVESEDRNKVLTQDELYTYDYTTYQQIDTSEEKITNAIINLTTADKPKIYFLEGHNEYGIEKEMTILKTYLENEINEVSTLDLLVKNEIPQDTSLLVIASPQKDMLDKEAQIIINYINKGGKILFMNDPTYKGETYANFQKVLDLFGVKFDEGIILEQDSNKMALQSPNYIIPEVASTKATKNIVTDGGILLINSSKVTIADEDKLNELNVTNETILTTGKTALFRKEVSNGSITKIASDEEGSFIIGAKLTKSVENEKQATMYVIANNFFVVDYPITIGNSQLYPIQFYNNKDYILNTIAELNNRENTISIRKDTGVITYTATEAQDRNIKLAIVVLPVVVIIAGIVIWYIRRRKK